MTLDKGDARPRQDYPRDRTGVSRNHLLPATSGPTHCKNNRGVGSYTDWAQPQPCPSKTIVHGARLFSELLRAWDIGVVGSP